MKKKKIPMRKCIGCGKEFEKKDLIRIVKNKEGEVFLDKTAKANGRGAYICKDISCFNNIKDTNKLGHSLKAKLSDDLYEEIEAYVKES